MPLQTIGLIIGAVAILFMIAGTVSVVRGRTSVEQRLQTFAGTTDVESDTEGLQKTLNAGGRFAQSGFGRPQGFRGPIDAAGASRPESDRG